MVVGIEKSAMIVMKSWTRVTAERSDLQNKEIIRTLRKKENYKNYGILEADTIKQVEIKEKCREGQFQMN